MTGRRTLDRNVEVATVALGRSGDEAQSSRSRVRPPPPDDLLPLELLGYRPDDGPSNQPRPQLDQEKGQVCLVRGSGSTSATEQGTGDRQGLDRVPRAALGSAGYGPRAGYRHRRVAGGYPVRSHQASRLTAFVVHSSVTESVRIRCWYRIPVLGEHS